MLGKHSQEGDLSAGAGTKVSMPFQLPSALLNRFSVQAFNELYFRRIRGDHVVRKTHYEPFFYPLDAIAGWNKLYGKAGFTQYQFVIPKDQARVGMRRILEKIASEKRGSFLAVLKVFGQSNQNPLSFPMEGLTLALDFKVDRGLFELLHELDQMVCDLGVVPYRLSIEQMPTFFDSSYKELIAKLKKGWDPANILSPGRYDGLD